jgi:hypothetical protein
MISVSEMVFVPRNVRSFALCEAMVGKAMPGKPTEMAAGEMPTTAGEMRTATSEMCTTVGEMPTASTEMPIASTEMATASTEMATASTEMATASSTMCERGGGPERQNAGQNQTDK